MPKTTMTEKAAALTEEVEAALARVTNWQRDPHKTSMELDALSARGYTGSADGWSFGVADFSIENQGFPAGSRGYDGAATHRQKGILFHLTQDMAERAVKAACKLTEC